MSEWVPFSELRKIVGSTSPDVQLKYLRDHGIEPFVSPSDGRPWVTYEVINRAMLNESQSGVTINENI